MGLQSKEKEAGSQRYSSRGKKTEREGEKETEKERDKTFNEKKSGKQE